MELAENLVKRKVRAVLMIVAFGIGLTVATAGSAIVTVASWIPGAAKPAGFLDQGFKALFGPLIGAVEGKGYEPWFLAMAFLHPLALVLLWLGGIHRPRQAAA